MCRLVGICWHSVGVVTFCVLSLPAEAQVHDAAIEALTEAAAAYSSNYSQLETWSGRARVTSGYVEPPGTALVSEVAFFWAGKQRVRWVWKDVAMLDMSTGKESRLPEPLTVHAMILDGAYYEYSDETNRGANQRQAHIKELRTARADKSGRYFEPTWYFDWGQQSHADKLTAFIEQIQNGAEFNVNKFGSRITVEPINKWAINIYEYDLAQGGNCMRFMSRDTPSSSNPNGLPVITWSNEWEKVEGVWLPKTVIYEALEQRVETALVNGEPVSEIVEGATDTFIRRIEFLEHRVNEPIASDHFSIDRMGLKPGDWINNRLTGTLVVYKEEELAAKLIGDDGSGRKRVWQRWLLFANGIAVLALLGGWLLLAQLKRRRSTK